MELQQFTNINNSMYWKEPAIAQIQEIINLGKLLKTNPQVIGEHTSKSVKLPVVEYNIQDLDLTLIIRDNFHDINLLVQSKTPITIPLSTFYKPLPYSWYLDKIRTKRNYSYAGWTQEEINDPRILRVLQQKEGREPYWSTIEPKAKDRWAARHTSTEWYEKDWSSGKLITEGKSKTFDENTTFYEAPQAFAQGMSKPETKLPEPYNGNSNNFLNSFNTWDELKAICQTIINHIKDTP